MSNKQSMTSRQNGSVHGQLPGSAPSDSFIIGPDDRILVTGATGFIGSRVVESLVDRGFRNVVCFARPSSDLSKLEAGIKRPTARDAHRSASRQSPLSRGLRSGKQGSIRHLSLAAGTGEKSFPDAFHELSCYYAQSAGSERAACVPQKIRRR